MKSIVIYSIIIIIFCMILVGGEFRLYPLKLKLNSWTEFVSWIMLILSVSILSASYSKREYKRGYEDGMKDIIEYVKDHKDKK